MKRKNQSILLLLILCALMLYSCESSQKTHSTPSAHPPTKSASTVTPTKTLTPIATETPIPSPAPTKESNSWDRYTPRTMVEIIETVNIATDIDGVELDHIYLEMSSDFQEPSQVRMTYTGEFRDITDPRTTMISIWLGTFAGNLSEAARENLFKTEALFIENGTEYWIPVQLVLVDPMRIELQPGDEVNLYLLWIGAAKTNNGVDYVFLVNEFLK